jgi:formylglycine-generating enzyme required for sulfatase activity
VYEWCLDEWHGNYDGAPVDGRAWVDGKEEGKSTENEKSRLLRGGSWDYHPGNCRSAYRCSLHPDARYDFIGFRVCCLPQG